MQLARSHTGRDGDRRGNPGRERQGRVRERKVGRGWTIAPQRSERGVCWGVSASSAGMALQLSMARGLWLLFRPLRCAQSTRDLVCPFRFSDTRFAIDESLLFRVHFAPALTRKQGSKAERALAKQSVSVRCYGMDSTKDLESAAGGRQVLTQLVTGKALEHGSCFHLLSRAIPYKSSFLPLALPHELSTWQACCPSSH